MKMWYLKGFFVIFCSSVDFFCKPGLYRALINIIPHRKKNIAILNVPSSPTAQITKAGREHTMNLTSNGSRDLYRYDETRLSNFSENYQKKYFKLYAKQSRLS